MLRRIRKSRAFTLVELMIVVAIVGVLAALAIYGVKKYLTNSKTAEARNALGQISKAAQAEFGKEDWKGNAGIITPGQSAGPSSTMCPSAAKPVPADLTAIDGKKYQSSDTEWNDGAGWSCLKFSMSGPQYYQYDFQSAGSASNATFTALAKGNLDGDKDYSTFSIDAAVQSDGTLAVAPAIKEDNPEE